MKKPLLLCLLLAACDHIPSISGMRETGKEAGIERLAEATRAAGDVESTLELKQQAARNHPEDADRQAELAELQLSAGKTAEAVLTLRQALKHNPDDSGLQLLLVQATLRDQKPAKALPLIEKYLRPGAAEESQLLTYRGIALDMLGQTADAQAAYKEALAIAAPESSTPIRSDLAMSYLVDGKLREAASIWQQLCDEGEDTATIRQNLALAYAMMGQDDRAMELALRDMDRKQAQENIDFAHQLRDRRQP